MLNELRMDGYVDVLRPSQGSIIQKGTDMVLAFAIPAHMHITMNACVSDYLPMVARGEC